MTELKCPHCGQIFTVDIKVNKTISLFYIFYPESVKLSFKFLRNAAS